MNWKTIIKEATRILKREEGWRGYIYDDIDGHRLEKGQLVRGTPTVGYGFTLLINDPVPQEIYEMFPRWGDMGVALHVKKIIDYDLQRFYVYLPHLNEARLVVLICMVYQLGFTGVLGFTNMVKAIIDEDWDKVADEMLDSKWAREDSPARAERMAVTMRKGKL